jgi:hypothetical protein
MMFITHILSNLGAWEILQKEYGEQYRQILKAIEEVNPEQVNRNLDSPSRHSLKHLGSEIERLLKQQLSDADWSTDKQLVSDGKPSSPHSEIDVMKGSIGVEIAAGNISSAESTIFVKFPLFVQSAGMKIGVLILPSWSIAQFMTDRTAYFEKISDRMHNIVPLLPKYPFVIIGISHKSSDLVFQEFSASNTMINEPNKSADRHLKVFLCHSSGDKPVIIDLYQKLVAIKNVDPWLDDVKLFPGVDWNNEIINALKDSDVVIVCLSNASIKKEGYVQKEIRRALSVAEEKPEGTIFIIPLKVDDCQLPQSLSQWQAVNYYREGAFDRLLTSLRMRAISLGITIG